MNGKRISQSAALLIAISFFLMATLTAPQAAESAGSVAHETGFYYTVQKGDTLWDLSQKFADTPWVWPEMWQENKQIANPHRIYPGERIRLHRREGVFKQPAQKPVEHVFYDFSPIDQVGFIRRTAVNPRGEIYKVREGPRWKETKKMINDGDIIYLRPIDNASLEIGQRYTIYRTLQPIKTRKTDKYIGIQHYLSGVVEIIQQEAEYSIGLVVQTYRPIKIGDLLMPYNRRQPSIQIQPSQPGIEGQIIESEEHRTIMGETNTAFFDKGKVDGIRVGQFYNIYYQDKHEFKTKTEEKSKVLITPVDIGELLVVHTENTTSTVLITNSENEFEAGARVRSPIQ